MEKQIYLCVALLLLNSCKDNGGTEKFQNDRMANTVSVEDKIIDIKNDLFWGSVVSMNIVDDFLVIIDMTTKKGKAMHFFDRKTLKHVTSSGYIGQGPGEIARIGDAGVDKKNKMLWVSDWGKNVMWSFPLDSILNNSQFKPTRSVNSALEKDMSLTGKFEVLNDSIGLGAALFLINHSLSNTVGRLNMNTNKVEKYGYLHPEAIHPRSRFYNKISIENGIYINCYSRCDLMTICDLNGNLRCNVYGGNDWFNKDKKKSYFGGVDTYKKNIIASYNGEVEFVHDTSKSPKVNYPSRFLVFDLEGNHKRTIETGTTFTAFCVDEDNKRIIAYFDNRENPLGYFDLDWD